MKNYFHSAGVVLILCVACTLNVAAQCNGFVKREINLLSPFVYNGRTNTATLMPGDHSELSLTFYSGNTYRIVMKSAEMPGNVSFTIKDANGKYLFKSTNAEPADYYDFTSESTQQLTIDMMVKENNLLADNATSQCVVVVVGQKE